jgi:hypothetical protein
MDPAQVDALRKEANRHLLVLLRARSRADFRAAAAGPAKAGDADVELLTVSFDGATTTLGIDPTTGRVLTARYRGRPGVGSLGEIIESFSDFRTVDGLTIPFGRAATWKGRSVAALSVPVATVRLNLPIDPTRFRP